MNLYVDIGNSRIRLVQGESSAVAVHASFYTHQTLPAVFKAYRDKNPVPVRVMVSNVAGDELAAIFDSLCERFWGLCPEYIEVSAESNGVRNGYRDISQLGVDRWLAMIAARDKYNGNLCVVDCGSAVTIDMVDADGQHQGGYIIPGHYLMQQSLVNNTSRLSVSGVYEPTVAMGHSTEECINNGTILAVSCLIEHVIQTVGSDSCGSYKCIITGGGAEEVMALLKIDYSHEPLLVIDGIRLLAGPGT